MPSLLQTARTLQTQPFRSLRQQKMSFNFFQPSVPTAGLGLSRHQPLEPTLRRLASSTRRGSLPPYSGQTNMYLLYGLMGVNASVFLYYQYLAEQARQGHPHALVNFVRNFTLNVNGFKNEGRWWTTLTSVFTHFGPMHLAANLISVYYMGQLVAHTPGIGPLRMLTLIIGSGLAGSAGHLMIRSNAMKEQHTLYDSHRALGFSGAVMGVGAVAACFYPRTTFALYGIVPVPLWGLMLGYGLYDGYFLGSEKTGIGHAGHVGGLVFGLVYYFARLRGIIPLGI